ncbi:hypothetical protein JQ608_47570 [Bradyrhizobium liaoningense]|nr:hypothetical protein [Bradyrhizobium liaoningense]MBR1004826.1 hypothetical protein [Bradyrhizobium liaoningense]MBR1071152.1 hypothetical protein [Bradyrhizobium liaoningense]
MYKQCTSEWSRHGSKNTVVRREWTKDDLRQLKAMAKENAGVAKVVKKLKRTVQATTMKASTLGISLSTPLKRVS